MKIHKILLCLALVGCDQKTNTPDLQTGEVQISYQATSDAQGACRPRYQAITQMNAQGQPENDLFMITGQSIFFDPTGKVIGRMPLQATINDPVTSLLNQAIACEALSIQVTILKCQYQRCQRS